MKNVKSKIRIVPISTIQWTMLVCLMTLGLGCAHNEVTNEKDDPFIWLEDIEGDRAIEWVKTHNESTLRQLTTDPVFKQFEQEVRTITLAKDRLPGITYRNGFYYNFWQDEKNVRGLWRRTSLKEYKKEHSVWETVLDIDALAESEKENWVLKGIQCLRPEQDRCLITLSRGGKDASVVREFEISSKSFVKDGFTLPEAKSRVRWLDENRLFVGTDFGPGSMTKSGYPRLVKIWKRGTPLDQATLIFEGKVDDVSVNGYSQQWPEGRLSIISESIGFYDSKKWLLNETTYDRTPIPLPNSAEIIDFGHGNRAFVSLRDAWTFGANTYPAGSVIAFPISALTNIDEIEKSIEVVFTPSSVRSFSYLSLTKNRVLLGVKDNVNGKVIEVIGPQKGLAKKSENHWTEKDLGFPKLGITNVYDASAFDEPFMISHEGFLEPTSISYAADQDSNEPTKAQAQALKNKINFEKVKSAPKRFNEKGMVSSQEFAISKDGTKVPYYLVHKGDLKRNGLNPTLLYGYGGFESSQQPFYMGSTGKVWLERGGVYVLGNIRGGGEFGPDWHKAALKENRQKAFDDFIAIAEDLIAKKIASPETLGIKGGSNGGLLVGAAFTQRPELFNAVVCQVPLLDMFRYHKLLAGASWAAEYGTVDDDSQPKVRDAIFRYSPYQNVKPGVKYPEVLFVTSTKDDRVHPGHARKMAAKMESMSHRFYYYENIEGGHGAAANLEQHIYRSALENTYLFKKLSVK